MTVRPHPDAGPRSAAATANAGRNANGGRARHARWAPARDAAWALLSRHVAAGARVAVVGAGNGDTLPLARLAARAGALDLVDLDAGALRRARRRCGLRARRRVQLLEVDLTGGEADAVVRAAVAGGIAGRPTGQAPESATGLSRCGVAAGGALATYDVVVADCFYTQLLYPALADAGLAGAAIDRVLLESGQGLTNRVVAGLHAAAPGGVVVHLHDLLGWWDGRPQPFALDDVLALASGARAGGGDAGRRGVPGDGGAEAALRLALKGSVPYGCDPRAASARLGAEVIETAFWRWPFGGGVDYLVCATVCR